MTDLRQALLAAAADEPSRASVAVGADEVAAARALAADGLVRLLPGGRVPLRVGFVLTAEVAS